MIEFIKNAIQSISNFFTTVWEIITSLIDDIIYVVKLLASIVAQIPSLFSWLPPAVLALFILAIGLVVVYKVLGRTE